MFRFPLVMPPYVWRLTTKQSGNTALAGEDPVYLWLYLVFFNILWVFIPLWVLYESFTQTAGAFKDAARTSTTKKSR